MKEDSSKNVKIILFTQNVHSYYIERFVGETLSCAVLDIACTKNVCGQLWLDSYLDSLTPGNLLKAVEEKRSSSFNLMMVIQYYQLRLQQFQQQLGKMMS